MGLGPRPSSLVSLSPPPPPMEQRIERLKALA